MTHRTRLPLVLLLALALLAAACGGDSGDGGDTASDEFDDTGGGGGPECPVDAHLDADGPVEVVVWHTYVAETRTTLIALADEYNASQDKVEVRIETQGQSYEELLRKYTESIPTGDLPAISIQEDTTTQFMADSGTILPGQVCFDADGISLDDYLPIGVGAYSIDGAIQPASLNISSAVLWYNRDHFRSAGLDPDAPPTNLAELRAAAEAIAEADIAPIPVAMNLQPWFMEYWLTGMDESIVDNDNGRGPDETAAGTFENEVATEAMDWLKGMSDDGLMNPIAGTEAQFDHYYALALQTSSMTLETSTAASTIDAVLEGTLDPEDLGLDDDFTLPDLDLDIDMAFYPGLEQPATGQVGGGAWYLTGDAVSPEVQAGAWDFVKFINSPDSQVTWNLDGSYLPWNLESVDDPELQDAWENTRRGRWLATAYDQVLNLDPDFPGPLIGPYDQVRIAVRKAMEAVTLGGADPAGAIAAANEEITDVVANYAEVNF